MSATLDGKAALVTETGPGIGRAIALRFADAGATVVCLDADGSEADRTARQIEARGGTALALTADVSRSSDVDDACARVEVALGGLDVLCNNTSTLVSGTIEETEEADWDRIFSVNVKPIYLMTRRALPLLRERRGGAVVNLASSLALIGFPGLAAYSASKGAVRMLTKCMAIDHARDGVRVNCICHGGIDDPLLRGLFDAMPDPASALATFLDRIPTHKLATVEDMANAALFLASDASAGTTGSELVVDGGQTAW
jgi:NAD(P)-dependent dehydrogenase (short-subunit alcohol dehydrogenase family)